VRAIRDQCVAAGMPSFFKQSAARRTEGGAALVEADGSTTIWRQYPDELAPSQRRASGTARDGQAPTRRQLELGLAPKR
jgi:hypothetical protein